MFSGYADGLILFYDISKIFDDKKQTQTIRPLIGHINKINQMCIVDKSMYSISQDCTMREWSIEDEICKKTFKF